jgi:hypothetical protein
MLLSQRHGTKKELANENITMPEISTSKTRQSKQQYRCNICDKPFDSAETLDSHQRFEHSEPGHSKPVAGVG